MAINKNHEFEELNGVKCGIVERLVKPDRAVFLTKLLEANGFTVISVPSPPPKNTTATEIVPPEEEAALPVQQQLPDTVTIGVTDYTFNTINAIFGRLLKTIDGHIVTLAYWRQESVISNDEIPYLGNAAG